MEQKAKRIATYKTVISVICGVLLVCWGLLFFTPEDLGDAGNYSLAQALFVESPSDGFFLWITMFLAFLLTPTIIGSLVFPKKNLGKNAFTLLILMLIVVVVCVLPWVFMIISVGRLPDKSNFMFLLPIMALLIALIPLVTVLYKAEKEIENLEKENV